MVSVMWVEVSDFTGLCQTCLGYCRKRFFVVWAIQFCWNKENVKGLWIDRYIETYLSDNDIAQYKWQSIGGHYVLDIKHKQAYGNAIFTYINIQYLFILRVLLLFWDLIGNFWINNSIALFSLFRIHNRVKFDWLNLQSVDMILYAFFSFHY